MKPKTRRILWGAIHTTFIAIARWLIGLTSFCEKIIRRSYRHLEDATFEEALAYLNKEFDR